MFMVATNVLYIGLVQDKLGMYMYFQIFAQGYFTSILIKICHFLNKIFETPPILHTIHHWTDSFIIDQNVEARAQKWMSETDQAIH